jgi:hypothetical protein
MNDMAMAAKQLKHFRDIPSSFRQPWATLLLQQLLRRLLGQPHLHRFRGGGGRKFNDNNIMSLAG